MAGRVDNKTLSDSRILNSIYYDPKQTGSYGGIDRLRRASHSALGASGKEVKRWLSEQDTYTLHKPVRYRFRRRRVVVGGINHQWQADLVDMSRLKRYNDEHTFVLPVIDVFSKKSLVCSFEKQVGVLTHGCISSPAKEQRWTTENADGQRKRVSE